MSLTVRNFTTGLPIRATTEAKMMYTTTARILYKKNRIKAIKSKIPKALRIPVEIVFEFIIYVKEWTKINKNVLVALG